MKNKHEIADMVAMRRRGFMIREIGAKYGLSKGRVCIILQRELKVEGPIRKDVRDMIAMRRKGFKLREIGDKHGLSRQRVSILLLRDGPPDLELRAFEAQERAKTKI